MKTLNYDFKTGFIASWDEVINQNEMHKNNYSFRVLKQPIFMAQVALFYPKNHYLRHAFDEKMRLLKSNGLINFWISKHMDEKHLNVKPAKKGPEKINLGQISAGFQLWVIGLCVSFCVFIIETTTHALKVAFEK